MRFLRAGYLFTFSGRTGVCLRDAIRLHAPAALSSGFSTKGEPFSRFGCKGDGHGGGAATSPEGSRAVWLLAAAAAAAATPTAACSADAPPHRQSDLAAPALTMAAAAAAGAGAAAGSGGGGAPPALTNHPLEYDPVTNEHTAKMTMARTAAIELYNARKYAQAEAKFREAVSEAQLGFPAGDPHIASAMNNLAEFLRNTGRWDEAEEQYQQALELLERSFGERHWLFVGALHNLALCCEARGDLPAAAAAMRRVLALRRDMFGPRHFLTADSLFALGHMQRAAEAAAGVRQSGGGGFGAGGGGGGGGSEGLRMMEEAVRTLEEAEKLQLEVVLHWLAEVAACHSADGRPDAAAAVLRRAVAHLAAERGEEAASASALNERLTEALEAAGRPAEAAEAAEAALAARRGMFGEGALVVAQSEMRVAQLQLSAAAAQQRSGGAGAGAGVAAASLPPPAPPGLDPALRALQHADAAARVSAANAEECSRGGLLSGPPADKLVRRLRAAHTLGSAAKMVATLAGVPDPAAAAAAAAAASAPLPSLSSTAGVAAPSSSSSSSGAAGGRSWSWWPFGRGGSRKAAGAAPATPAARPPLPPAEPVAELALADRRLEQAAAALTGAVAAGKQLLQAVGSGQRQLPSGVSVDEVAGLLVEAQLQLLDVLERLGLLLQARVAAGEGAQAGAAGAGGGDVVARHRRVLEQQERVAAELLGRD